MVTELVDRFTGCLLGLAVGDALGAPAEFMTAAAIQRIYGRIQDMLGGGWLELKPGQVTDDTQMMLCMAESLVARHTFDSDDLAQHFVRWYRNEPRDVGRTTEAALSRIATGIPWRQAAQEAHKEMGGRSASNGGLMRCAPLGLFYHSNTQLLLEYSAQSSQITHWDARAAYAASALNLVIAGILSGLSIRQALEQARDTVRLHQQDVAKALDNALTGPYTRPEVSGLAVDTLHAACRCFYQSRNLEEAIVEAVNLGGDTDTVGAVCGAMAGAYYGEQAIPRRWLQALEGKEHIRSLAIQLFHLSQDALTPAPMEETHGQ